MTYQATRDVVRRVMPLLERLAKRSLDRARLLHYLSARAGEDWGVLDLVADLEADPAVGATSRVLVFRDRLSGAEYPIRYPTCLDETLEPLVRTEYQRLATDHRLSMMDEPLFSHFFTTDYCDHCRWRGPAHEQIHRECRFAGHPINFDPADP